MSIIKKTVAFPLFRMIVGMIVVIAAAGLARFVSESILNNTALSFQVNRFISTVLSCAATLYSYYFLFRWYEKRKVLELSSDHIFYHLGFGSILGFVLQSLTIAVIWLLGSYQITAINPLTYLLSPFIFSMSSAILEEVIVRGIIFRLLEELAGTYIALVISALLFGALHLANPNSSLAAGLGLALQAGVFLAAAFVYSRNLWFPIAIHFAWNFTQGGIYGASVSGNAVTKSLFHSSIEGETWYTGGVFGPEGSVQATVFCFVTAVLLLIASDRQNKIQGIPASNKKKSLT